MPLDRTGVYPKEFLELNDFHLARDEGLEYLSLFLVNHRANGLRMGNNPLRFWDEVLNIRWNRFFTNLDLLLLKIVCIINPGHHQREEWEHYKEVNPVSN